MTLIISVLMQAMHASKQMPYNRLSSKVKDIEPQRYGVFGCQRVKKLLYDMVQYFRTTQPPSEDFKVSLVRCISLVMQDYGGVGAYVGKKCNKRSSKKGSLKASRWKDSKKKSASTGHKSKSNIPKFDKCFMSDGQHLML